MYLVYMYDNRKYLVDRFTASTYNDAMKEIVDKYHDKRTNSLKSGMLYEIIKVADNV